MHDNHQALGAKFADFAGWQMPIEYPAGVLAEHAAVRESVGIFDVSHMGTLFARGTGAKDAINQVLTNDLDKIGSGQAQYSLLCNERGGVIDDVFVYLRSDADVVIIPNASNVAAVSATVERVLESSDVALDNVSSTHAILAVQGPKSPLVIAAIGLDPELGYLQFVDVATDAGTVLLARTGYTGEVGYELVVEAQHAPAWWGRLLEQVQAQGGLPCGLGARDTLRTEMGYPLHGHEITPQIDPVSAGLAWAIGWKKPAFPGKSALVKVREEGPAKRLVGLKCIDRGIPRTEMTVFKGDRAVGQTTSGTFSPTLKTGIALAYIDADLGYDTTVDIEIRGRKVSAILIKPPFVPTNPRV